MEQYSNKNLVQAIGKFSQLLVQKQVIDIDKDEKALNKAMSNVAQQIINLDSLSSSQSSLSFVKGPLVEMMTRYQETQQKLEEKRNQQLVKELSQLQSKPTINKTSQKIVKSMPPLHLRTKKLIQEQELKIESQRTLKKEIEDQEFVKTCTFKPRSRSGSRSRSPDVVTKELYQWNDVRIRKVEVKVKEKEKREKRLVGGKPKIDNLSEKLCKLRCATPVHERLSKKVQRPWVESGFSFTPSVNEKSKKILKRRSKSRDGLESRLSQDKSKDLTMEKFRKKGEFRINSSIGTYKKQSSYINCCKTSDPIKFCF